MMVVVRDHLALDVHVTAIHTSHRCHWLSWGGKNVDNSVSFATAAARLQGRSAEK